MATPTPTVTDYCGVLTRSRLLPAGEVAALADEWRSTGTDADVDAFRRFLVARRSLTEYQAALVGRGHSEGFFIGGYVILDRIGKGQTAAVYKAVHESGQLVAVKVLPASRARNPHTLGRFQREGRLLTQLNHPNVVRAYQVGNAGGINFIAMEYLEGETLDETLERRKQIPPAEAARLVQQALHGLQHLHDRRMIHRDLKPANLIVVPADPHSTLAATVKILDIGLGRELFDEADSSTHDMHLTAEGAILGTPDYLAPEQARDARGADVRADVYSLGCVLFHLLTGRPPFVEKNVMAVMVRHASEAPVPASRFAPGVPPGLQAVLTRMLAKDPAGRYATPAAAADALRPFVPADAAAAEGSAVLPAFERWLEAESTLEQVAALRPPPPPLPAKSNGSSGAIRVGPERTRPAADDPSAGRRSAAVSGPPAGKMPRPPGLAGPTSGKIQRPPGMGGPPHTDPGSASRSLTAPPSGKFRVGTGLAAALAGGTPAAAPVFKPPSVPGRPSPLPPAAVAPPADDIDVELIVLPGVRAPEPVDVLDKVTTGPPLRPLWDLDRRDFIMLGIGAGGTLAAIVTGVFLAKTNTQKLRGGDEEYRENQP